MASQTRTFDKKKLLGQIYTPIHIVEKILKDTGFYELDFSSQTILDPACGDGRFLISIAQYIIENSSIADLKRNLENIHGWDIDPDAITACRYNLDELVKPYSLDINWNLENVDALIQIDRREKFDLIIGNPPYIRIQNLANDQRLFIQQKYSFCRSGSTDTYVAFFQLACQLTNDSGTCGFITPNSFLSSETGKILRKHFVENQNLKQITNYRSVRIFGNTGTYAAITIFGKQSSETFRYELSDYDFQYGMRNIFFSELSSDSQWHLSTYEKTDLQGTALGDICQISVGLTTLADNIFLLKILEEKDGLFTAISKNGIVSKFEKAILKPIIKGSKLKNSSEPITEHIIFPYEKDDTGKHKIIPEDILKAEFPNAYKYLKKNKGPLLKRDNGKVNPVAWYAYGRAQGLDSSFGKKIIFSPMNRFPNFVLYDNPDCTVYSGYFIKYKGEYEHLLSQLNSQRMADFISIAGRDFQGGYKGYNKKVVENFIITDLP
ncbi:SAM-dependent methyltransferase [Dyadobacter sp. CY345]|uniref:Eco57I restriction-modification methylase domain-containing protein n=1 Tax=Dyadobacter sp. CY345 TaxID=2909335 RepID=UPI001F2223F0|nr:N-6 DNA methylase [Dyadobacter sp. CY345]MCF2446395.1 SAM-dependent methyltransferase [Dyadobacter sp. CY345]